MPSAASPGGPRPTGSTDTALLKRIFLGWLPGEPDHCQMAAVPTFEEEDVRRSTHEYWVGGSTLECDLQMKE